ncbi:YesL family protein [Solwaraspora sp. WMMD406]|uniref:YesL family protein n=1 Tax=Solwaraspora sp. WMMD406 TaxID=3016095 RepID=UPI002416E3AB|nr:YesL family protein [Solwaraspora sp. WMMD406]MDG4764142.1 YesL family protein [Solwaraspora sp. WMMD406]
MNDPVTAQRQFGTGPLSRIAAIVYRLIVVELLLLACVLPGLVPAVLLDRDPSNIPLYAACAIPLGPALSAALYAIAQHRPDLTDLNPAVDFWRGYRANLGGILRIWLPLLVASTIVAVNLAWFDAAGVPAWWGALLVLVAVAATAWGGTALVITSLFAFRARDVARLAAYFLTRTPGTSLGVLALAVVAAGITAYTSEAVLALAGSVLALLLLRTGRPMTTAIEKEFTQ